MVQKGYRKPTVSDSLQNLLSDLESRGVVCPLPKHWDKLCRVIKSVKKLKVHPIEKGPQTEVTNPLILAAWGASDKSKWERFKYHLSEADQLGILYLAEEFLTKLQPSDFLMSEAEYSDISVWDIEKNLKNEVEKVLAEALPFIQEALDLNIDKRHHYDPEKLYALFRDRGFFAGHAPTVSDASDLQTVQALRRANEIFNKQADLIEGYSELKNFCYAVLDLKVKLRL